MSSLRDKARLLDERDDIVGAAAAYEELLSSGEASVDDLIALALIYWATADSGIAASKGISRDAEHHARRRLEEVLGEAVRRDPANCEAKFWTMYCSGIMYAEPGTEAIDELLNTPGNRCDGAFASMWRLVHGDRSVIPAGQLIVAQSDIRRSSKGRYMASIISGTLTRLRLEDERAGQ